MGQEPAGQDKPPRGECPICAADGRSPNRETRRAIHQIENGESYRYTDSLGPNLIRNILNGDYIEMNKIVDEVRDSAHQEEEHA